MGDPTWAGSETTDVGLTLATHVSVLPPEDADDAAPAGEDPPTFPRFELAGKLGAGGLGEVFAARDRDIGRRVAIKRVRPDRGGAGIARRFAQEVRTIGALDHPGIVPIYDVGRDDEGALFFVMKHVEGETIEDLIARLRAGDAEAHAAWDVEHRLNAFLFLCHAVAHAHRQGVLHRDIKPANVMVGRDGQVQLLDWGVSKAQPDDPEAPGGAGQTRVGARIGTPRYMSPELTRGEPADARSETWALCLLLYEWLTLTYPFRAPEGDVEALYEAIRTQRPPFAAAVPAPRHQAPIPADVSWLLSDGLDPDPARRFASVDALIAALERHARGEVDVRCPVTLHLAMSRKTERVVARAPWLVAVVGLLALAGGGLSLVGAVALVAWTVAS